MLKGDALRSFELAYEDEIAVVVVRAKGHEVASLRDYFIQQRALVERLRSTRQVCLAIGDSHDDSYAEDTTTIEALSKAIDHLTERSDELARDLAKLVPHAHT